MRGGGQCWEEKQNAEDAEPLLARRLTTSYPETILQLHDNFPLKKLLDPKPI